MFLSIVPLCRILDPEGRDIKKESSEIFTSESRSAIVDIKKAPLSRSPNYYTFMSSKVNPTLVHPSVPN